MLGMQCNKKIKTVLKAGAGAIARARATARATSRIPTNARTEARARARVRTGAKARANACPAVPVGMDGWPTCKTAGLFRSVLFFSGLLCMSMKVFLMPTLIAGR